MPHFRKRTDIQLAYVCSEKRLSRFWPYLVQPKLNGERCRALRRDDDTWQLVSSTGLEIFSVPHINLELEQLQLPEAFRELDGELYFHGQRLQETASIVSRKVNLHELHQVIQFHVFDIPQPDDTQKNRLLRLTFIPEGDFVKLVPVHICNNIDDISAWLSHYRHLNYEGIIIRNPHQPCYERKRTTDMLKLKPRYSGEFVVIGMLEEYSQYGQPKDALGALVCLTSDGKEFRVGTGFTTLQRQNFWQCRDNMEEFPPIIVEYQELTRNGVPYAPSFKYLNIK